MAGVPDAITPLVVQIVRKHHNAPARTLARRVVAETNGALTLEQARTRVRRLLGQSGGDQARQMADKSLVRPARKPGQKVEFPKTQAEDWVPYTFNVVGRIGVISDVHVPYHSDIAFHAAVEHLKKQKIAGLLINGDFADFYSISHWEKRPKYRDFPGELRTVRESLAWLRKQFPGIPITYKLGNHEERYQKWLYQHAAEISDEPEMGIDVWLRLHNHDITLVQDQRIVMLGELPVLHGHELPRGISSPVNPARGAFMRTKHTVLIGHQHQTSGHCEPDMFQAETFCWSAGCLCHLTPEFSRINRWNWGFAIVEVEKDGQFDVRNLRITSDGVVRTS
jgi:predicted phosphodiesterase